MRYWGSAIISMSSYGRIIWNSTEIELSLLSARGGESIERSTKYNYKSWSQYHVEKYKIAPVRPLIFRPRSTATRNLSGMAKWRYETKTGETRDINFTCDWRAYRRNDVIHWWLAFWCKINVGRAIVVAHRILRNAVYGGEYWRNRSVEGIQRANFMPY